MLDANIKTQLKAYLEKLRSRSNRRVAGRQRQVQEMRGLLHDIAEQSAKVTLRERRRRRARPPSPSARRRRAPRMRFAGLPMGHEFTSLVLALLQTGGHPPKVDADVIEQIKALTASFNFETYISLSCHNCPDVVQALNLMAVLNPKIASTMIDGALFQEEVESARSWPCRPVYLNGEEFGQGRMSIEEILAKVDTGAAARAAEEARPPRTPSTCSSSAAARPARRRRSTPPARASAPASSPSASAAR
jgi:alkyl hydroperoxide reductase subunit F